MLNCCAYKKAVAATKACFLNPQPQPKKPAKRNTYPTGSYPKILLILMETANTHA